MLRSFTDNIKTLLRYRELVISLVSKELKARYRGSALGMLWTFLNPLLLLLVYALVFSVYMRMEMENYTVFMFTGLLPWIWFSTSMMEGVNSVTASGALITKSMFPAEILPMVKILSNLANYVFSLPLLFAFMLWFDIEFTSKLLWLPVVAFAQLLFTTGLVYFLSSLNVRFRDIQHILNNFIVLWFFMCPIIYPVSVTPEAYRFTFYLNPMAVLTMSYHDIFIYAKTPDLFSMLLIFALGVCCTLIGFYRFDISKETFAEEI